MKNIKILFLLSFFLTSIPLLAQTEEEAKAVALKFLQSKKGVALSGLSTVKINGGEAAARSNGKRAAAAANTGGDVYAFNADGGGFAVVCTGNGNTAVAGYSNNGKVDVEQMPESMKAWLSTYAAAMAKSGKGLVKDPSYAGPKATPVAPLIKTQWGQGAPFNGKCPSNGKQTTLAGCVPVALAQVLHYYKSNLHGTGELYYAHVESETEYNIDYSDTEYDWDNMLDKYEAGKYSQKQADAVAKLMLECGVACKAEYDYGNTPAVNPFVALSKYYRFDCTYLKRDFYMKGNSLMGTPSKVFYQPAAKWMKVIQDELKAGRPIIYSATDRAAFTGIFTRAAQSHCFVVDGIDADNYLHCNWGWSGLDDGYYDVAMLNPSAIEFLYDEPGFNCHHEMIVGIMPDYLPYMEKVYLAIQPFGEYNYMYTNSYESTKPTFYLQLMDQDANVGVSKGYSTTLSGWPTVNSFRLDDMKSVSLKGVADGEYQLQLGTRMSNGYCNYCYIPEAVRPTVSIKNNGTDVTYHGFGDDEGLVNDITISDITPASEIYAGTTFYLSIKGTGFRGKSSLKFRNMSTGVVYSDTNGGSTSFEFEHVYDNYASTEVFKFVPKNEKNGFSMPAGRYKIELPEDETKVKMDGEYYIDVAERPSYPIMDGSHWCSVLYDNDPTVGNLFEDERGPYSLIGTRGDFRIWNVYPGFEYANKVEEPVTVELYLVNVDTGEEMPLAVEKDWTPDKNYISIGYWHTYPLEGNYRIRCAYLTPDGKRGGLKQYWDDNKYKYYRILHNNGNDVSYIFRFVSAEVKKENGINSLDVVLNNESETTFANKCLKALVYDKEHDELSAVDVNDKSKVNPNENFTINLPVEIKENTEYIVWLQYSWSDSEHFYNVLDENNQIACVHIGKKSSTGISSVSLSDNLFAEGDLVKVYDIKGVLVKTVAASAHLWTDLQSQLSSGHYILKSATKTIKFRK